MVKTNLGNIAELIKTGKTPPSKESKYFGGDLSWYTPGDFGFNKLLNGSNRTITPLAFEQNKAVVFPEETLLITCIGDIGKIGITTTVCSSNQQITAIKPKNDVDVNYLYYWFLKNKIMLENVANNAVVPILNNKSLKSISFNYPPLKTQQKITAILDEADRLRQLDKQLIKKYEQLSQSLFLEMFGDTWNNPKGWDEYLIEEIASKDKYSIKAGPFGSALKKEFYTNSGYKIYGQEQVIRDDFTFGDYYIDEERFNKLKNCEIKTGDILISLVGTYGRISVVPQEFEKGIINPRLMKITPNEKIVRPVFLKILLQSVGVDIQLKNFSRGGTMDIVNVGIIRKVKIPVPPLEMQDIYLERSDLIQKQIESLKKTSQSSQDLFNSLLQRAFKGELVKE